MDHKDVLNNLFPDGVYWYAPEKVEEATAVVEEAASAGEVLGDAGMTVLIGLVVVIGALIVLTAIFYLFGFIMDKSTGVAKSKKAEVKEAPKAASEVQVAPAPIVEEGISGEVVAAIAAAVAMMAPEGKRYAVKSVSRAGGGRSAWSAAGLADNTRPF